MLVLQDEDAGECKHVEKCMLVVKHAVAMLSRKVMIPGTEKDWKEIVTAGELPDSSGDKRYPMKRRSGIADWSGV